MPNSAVKNGWQMWRFEEMAITVNDRIDDPSEAGVDHYVGLEHLDSDSLTIRRWGSPDDVEATKLRFRAGDIIFGRRRAYQRKLAVADFEGICSAHAMVLRPRPEVVFPGFLPFLMQSDMFMERAKEISVGSLSPTINWKALAKEQFALPLLEEQQRIAAACAETDKARESYLRLAASSAVLLRACVSALTEECRGSIQSIGSLVKEQIIAEPQDGNHGEKHPAASDYVPYGIPFLMATDIRNGRVDLTGCHFISAAVADHLRIGFAHEGDVLLTHKGTLGQVAELRGLLTDYAILTPQVTYYRVLDKSKLLPSYLYYVFQSADFQRQMASHGRQSTRLYVGITVQKTLSIPVPSLEVQEAIVDRCSSIAAARESALQRADKLQEMRRTIMRRAFSRCGI